MFAAKAQTLVVFRAPWEIPECADVESAHRADGGGAEGRRIFRFTLAMQDCSFQFSGLRLAIYSGVTPSASLCLTA